MTEAKRPLKVFLCHAAQDKPKVRELYRTLRRRGMQPWLDAEDLIPGQNWEIEIPKALYSSDAIIICLSPKSVDKEGYVQKEIRFALDKALEMPEGRIFLIPARLEECELPFSLSKFQAVNLFENDGYTKLMKALKLRASQLKLAVVELPKAGEITDEIEKIIEEKKEVLPSVLVAARPTVVNDAGHRQEANERTKQEQREREIAKRNAKDEAERHVLEHQSAEKAARQKAKRDVAEKAKKDRIERRMARILKLRENFAKLSVLLNSNFTRIFPALRNVTFAGVVIVLAWLGFKNISGLSLLMPTVSPTATATIDPATMTATLTPTYPREFTRTPSLTPTVTVTPTTIPASSVLLQKNFEDGDVGASSKDGVWAVEQEPNGNQCLSGSGPAVGTPQIWYQHKETRGTDIAVETRVKFIQGYTLYLLLPSRANTNEHYGVALNEYGFGLMRTWSTLGRITPMLPVPGKWYTFRVEIKGDTISEYIDNLLFQEVTLQPPIFDRGVVIGYVIKDGDKVCFDDIRVWSPK